MSRYSLGREFPAKQSFEKQRVALPTKSPLKISRLEIPHPPLKNVFRLEAKGEAGLQPSSLKALGTVISPSGPTEATCASPAAASHHGPGHGLREQTDLGESGNTDAQLVLSAARWRPVGHIISWETQDRSWTSGLPGTLLLPSRTSECLLPPPPSLAAGP